MFCILIWLITSNDFNWNVRGLHPLNGTSPIPKLTSPLFLIGRARSVHINVRTYVRVINFYQNLPPKPFNPNGTLNFFFHFIFWAFLFFEFFSIFNFLKIWKVKTQHRIKFPGFQAYFYRFFEFLTEFKPFSTVKWKIVSSYFSRPLLSPYLSLSKIFSL